MSHVRYDYNAFISEILGFQGSEDDIRQGRDAVWTCRQIPMFRRNTASLGHEDGDSMFPQNVSTHLRVYLVS
jgi:hypothetical protein